MGCADFVTYTMKKTNTRRPMTVACALLALSSLPSAAGDSAKGATVVPLAQPSPCSERVVQPLFSRYASTATEWTLRAGYRNFSGMELQEVDGFDGYSYDIELTVPLSDKAQLRFYLPLQTDGSAKDVVTGEDMDVDGDGGLLDFPSLTLDYQFRKAANPGDFNLATYVGVGIVINELDAVNQNTGVDDALNHRGGVFLFGLKADKQLGNCWTFVGNIGGRYYWESDDLAPKNESDVFFLVDASAAFLYKSRGAWVYPGLELVYQGDFSNYNSLQVVPQVVVPVGSRLDINAGVAIGLADGPDTETRVQLKYRF